MRNRSLIQQLDFYKEVYKQFTLHECKLKMSTIQLKVKDLEAFMTWFEKLSHEPLDDVLKPYLKQFKQQVKKKSVKTNIIFADWLELEWSDQTR